MATAANAIERIATATGMLPATVFRAARALREADTNLWPQGSQGRGRAAHVGAAHLVNLALALAAANPITEAPNVVQTYRMLPYRRRFSDHEKMNQSNVTTHLQSMGWLGDDFEKLITQEATGSIIADDENFIMKYVFQLEIHVGEPWARINFTFLGNSLWRITDFYGPEQEFRPLALRPVLSRSATLDWRMMEMLASLLRDTLIRSKSIIKETAIFLDKDASVSVDQSDTADRCDSEQVRLTGQSLPPTRSKKS